MKKTTLSLDFFYLRDNKEPHKFTVAIQIIDYFTTYILECICNGLASWFMEGVTTVGHAIY